MIMIALLEKKAPPSGVKKYAQVAERPIIRRAGKWFPAVKKNISRNMADIHTLVGVRNFPVAREGAWWLLPIMNASITRAIVCDSPDSRTTLNCASGYSKWLASGWQCPCTSSEHRKPNHGKPHHRRHKSCRPIGRRKKVWRSRQKGIGALRKSAPKWRACFRPGNGGPPC